MNQEIKVEEKTFQRPAFDEPIQEAISATS